MTIDPKAVEAALIAFYGDDDQNETDRENMTAALTASAPFIRAQAIEECAALCEQTVTTYYEGMSAVDVRLSYCTSPKWRDGPSIAAAIRALKET